MGKIKLKYKLRIRLIYSDLVVMNKPLIGYKASLNKLKRPCNKLNKNE